MSEVIVSKNDDGISVLEVWNGGKKLTVYLPVSFEILQVYGPEITNASDFYESWQWLHDKEEA